MIIDNICSCIRGSNQPGESNSEVDHHKSNSNKKYNEILDNGTNVAAESHVTTLLCTLIISSFIVIRSLWIYELICMAIQFVNSSFFFNFMLKLTTHEQIRAGIRNRKAMTLPWRKHSNISTKVRAKYSLARGRG